MGGDDGAADEEAARLKELEEAAARKRRKTELKRLKTEKKKAAKVAKEKAAAEEAAKTVKLDFVVQLDQPLGMKIDHVEGHDTWPAEITAVVPDSQASKAGIVPGMYVVGMNGESTEGKTLDDVVQGVIAAKKKQTHKKKKQKKNEKMRKKNKKRSFLPNFKW